MSNTAFAQCNANAGPNVTTCAGGPTVLGATPAATGTPPFSYTWTPATGLSCTTCANPTFTGTSNTTYTLSIEDATGCVDNDNVNVTISPSPTAAFTFAPNNQCANVPVVFTNTSTGSGLTYAWNFGNPASGSSNTSTATNPSHVFATSGSGTTSFTVTLTVTNSLGCSASVSHTVTVLESPNAELLDPLTNFKNCDGSTFNLQVFDNTVPTTNNAYTINWGDGTPNFTAGAGTFPGGSTTHTYTTQDIFTITYTVTGTNGCTNTETYLASNITNPAIGVANPGGTTGCGPLNLCFPISGFSGNHPSTTYRVDYGDGSPFAYFTHPPPVSICHSYTTSSCASGGGAFTFSMTARNNCDSSTATVTPIRVYTGPQAHFTASPVPACVGSAVTFTNTSIAGFNSSCSSSTIYTWVWGDGSPNTTVFTNAAQTHVYTAPGNYTVTLTASNSCGPSSESQNVCIESPPVPSFTVTPTIGCAPLHVTTNNTSATLNTCNVTYNWLVTFNGSVCLPSSGLFVFTGGTSASSLNPQFLFNDPGTYTITLQVTNSCGTFTATQIVTVTTVPQITLPPLTGICAGQSVTPTATFNDCNNPITAYNWTFPTGTPGSFSGANPSSIVFTTSGSPSISVSATNSCGTTTTNTTLTVNNIPSAPIVPATLTVCQNDTIALTAGGTAGATYQWSGPAGFSSTLQNPTILNATAANAGVYTVTATVGTCTGPSSSITVNITSAPSVSISPAAPAICTGNNVTLVASGASTYTWSPATGLSTTTGSTVTASPTTSTTYTVTGNNGTCSNTAVSTVTINPLPIVNSGADQTVCVNPTPIPMNGSPAGGTWSGTGVTAAGLFTASTPGTFVLTYTFTDANGCTNTDALTITVNNPSVAVAGNDTTFCNDGLAHVITGLPIGGTWSGSGISSTGSFTPTSAGTFVVTYSIGAGSCLSTDNLSITVNPLPVVDAGLNQTICIDATPFTVTGTPGGGTWSGTGVNSSGLFTPLTAGLGSHVLTYSFTNPTTGCSNTDVVTITINALPVVNAGADTTICNQPIPVTLSGTPVGGTWSGSGISGSGVFTPTGTGTFTVTYTVTLGSGCAASDARDIIVVAPVMANAGIDESICHNAPSVSINGSPVGGTWSGTFITSTGVFTPSAPGTYTLTYALGTGNCLTTDDMVMTVFALPSVSAGLDIGICIDNGTVTLAGAPAGGVWTGTGVSIGGSFNPVVAGVGTHPLIYTVTNAVTTCSNADTLLATVHPLPEPAYISNPTACVGVGLNFTNASTGANSYQWSFGDGSTSILSDPTHIYSDTGTYTITLIATSLAGCNDTIIGTVSVFEPPTAFFSISPDSGCGPLTVSIADSSYGIGISYAWDFGNGNSSTLASPAPQTYQPGILSDTTYIITLNVSNFCATVTHTDTVRVKPIPTAIFGPNVDIGCSPLVLTFANNSLGLPDTYDWDFGDGTTSTISSALFTHTFTTGANDTTYTITLIVNNECGTDTATHTITILPNTVNAFFNTDVISGCVPLTVNFTQLSTGGTFSSWNFGDGNVSTLTSPTHTFTSAGTFIVALYVNDGCSFDTAYQTITVFPQPVVDFTTIPDSVCVNQVFSFLNMSTSLGGIQWDFGDGSTSTLTNPTHTYAASGTYNVTLTGISTVTGCTGSITKPIHVNITPTAAIVPGPISGCEPINIDFTNNSINASFYSWDFGDGNTSVSTAPSHVYTNDGTYIVTLIAQHLNGCSDTTTAIVTVFPKPVSSFVLDSPSSCYIPVTIQFTNTSTGATGFAWDFGNGLTSTLNNPTTNYSAVGDYTVSLIATNLFGCTDTSSYVYTVYNLPQASFSFLPNPGCATQPVSFTNTSTFGETYIWDFGDGSTSNELSPSHAYADSGVYSIHLIVMGEGGCGDTLSLPNALTIFPTPTADFSYINVQNIDPLSGTVEFTNLSLAATSYLWLFGNGNSSTDVNPIERYNQFGSFYASLLATNEYGCTDTLTKEIIVDFFSGLFVPNAIYPGHPEFGVANFMPKGVGLKTYNITIYDDWGNLIWESSSLDGDGRPTEYWDGTFNGVPVQQDAYVWKVQATFLDNSLWKGKEYEKGKLKQSGTVTVIR